MGRVTVERNISFDDVRKRYYVTFDFGVVDGKQIRKVKTFARLTDARKALRLHEAERVNGTSVAPKSTTIGEWLDYWMKNIAAHKNEESTLYGYRLIIENHIKPAMGDVQLQALKPKMIQEYYSEKYKTLTQNTVRRHHDLLRNAFQVAFRNGEIASNPFDKVSPPIPKKKDIQFYNEEQVKKLLIVCKGNRLEIPIKLGIYLGLRRGEICGLKWSNVDFENKVITINSTRTTVGSKVITKGTKSETSKRKAFMPDDLLETLAEEKQRQEEAKAIYGDGYKDGDYVFVWDNGEPYRPNYLSELFTKFIADAGLPPITLHGLRHSFAAMANKAGVSLYDISKTLGHSSTSITSDTYMHVIDSAHKETIQKVESLLNK